MGIYDNWTYTDLHQLNLDWILKEVKKVSNIDQHINEIILQMINDGTLTFSLTESYNPATEELVLSVGGI